MESSTSLPGVNAAPAVASWSSEVPCHLPPRQAPPHLDVSGAEARLPGALTPDILDACCEASAKVSGCLSIRGRFIACGTHSSSCLGLLFSHSKSNLHTSFKKSAAATKMSYKRNEDDRQIEDDDGDEEIGEHVNVTVIN